MPRMRNTKKQFTQWLSAADWQARLPDITALDGREAAGPLFALLAHGGDMKHRAALALGQSVARLADEAPEAARNILRRCMWHMSEESGNIGWGIPEAFAEILAHSPRMAAEFHAILVSYIIDTGHEDNFCDNALLRRSCYWAVGRLAQARPDLCARAQGWLARGLDDADVPCRGMAAWALGQMPIALETAPLLRRLAQAGIGDVCEVFDGVRVREVGVSALADAALHNGRGAPS